MNWAGVDVVEVECDKWVSYISHVHILTFLFTGLVCDDHPGSTMHGSCISELLFHLN